MPRRVPLILAAVIVLLGLPAFAEFYTDWLWFKELGYEQVFIRSLTARSTVTALAGLVVFALLAGNLAIAFRALRPWQFTVVTPEGPQADHHGPDAVPAAGHGGGGAGRRCSSASTPVHSWDTWL